MFSKTNVWAKIKIQFRFSKTFKNKEKYSYKKKKIRNEVFNEGDIAYERDFSNPNKKNWEKAMIEEVLSSRNYIVRLENKELVQRRHINDIIKLEEFKSIMTIKKTMKKSLQRKLKKRRKIKKTHKSQKLRKLVKMKKGNKILQMLILIMN